VLFKSPFIALDGKLMVSRWQAIAEHMLSAVTKHIPISSIVLVVLHIIVIDG
jgi:hypothetical protein